MEIKYEVCNCEMCSGNIRTIKKKVFDNVGDAIRYHETKKDGSFSWWEIQVKYSR